MHKTILLIFLIITVHAQAFQAMVTAYNDKERDHRKYHNLNCQGNELEVGMCAADLNYHHLGERIAIDGLGTFVVADCGSGVQGPNHIDVYVDSLSECNAWHTRHLPAHVVGHEEPAHVARNRDEDDRPSKPGHSWPNRPLVASSFQRQSSKFRTDGCCSRGLSEGTQLVSL